MHKSSLRCNAKPDVPDPHFDTKNSILSPSPALVHCTYERNTIKLTPKKFTVAYEIASSLADSLECNVIEKYLERSAHLTPCCETLPVLWGVRYPLWEFLNNGLIRARTITLVIHVVSECIVSISIQLSTMNNLNFLGCIIHSFHL